MKFRTMVKTLVNCGLKKVNLSMYHANYALLVQNEKKKLIQELHGAFSTKIFPQMGTSNSRDDLLAALIGTSVSEGLYILNYLNQSLTIEGDVCEFGVAQGATSTLLANEIMQTEKDLWLFDSFQGLPKPTEKDQLIDDIYGLGTMEKYEGTMCHRVDEVKTRLKAIGFAEKRTHFVEGFIEETIKREPLPHKVCFAYVDFDFYEPIVTALDFLHNCLSVGGTVIIDDYGFFSSGAKAAVDEFMVKMGPRYELIEPLPFAGHFCIITKRN